MGRWPAAGFIDSGLSQHSAGRELHGAEVSQLGMPSARVVVALDVVEHTASAFARNAAEVACRQWRAVADRLRPKMASFIAGRSVAVGEGQSWYVP